MTEQKPYRWVIEIKPWRVIASELKQPFINCGFLIGGFLIGAIVCALDGSPYQPWVSYVLMAIGGLVCARVGMR